jgi:hypothetical protein
MKESTTTSLRLVSINRRQLVLHSVDVDRLIGEDPAARLIWELVGRLDLGRYHAQIASVEGRKRAYRPAIVGQPVAVRLRPGDQFGARDIAPRKRARLKR